MTDLATVLSWQPRELLQVARRFQSVSKLLKSASVDVEQALGTVPRFDFDGRARDAGDARIGEQSQQMIRDAGGLQRVAYAIVQAQQEVEEPLATLKAAVAGAESAGLRVDRRDGTVTVASSTALSSAPSTASATSGTESAHAAEAEAHFYQVAIQSAFHNVLDADRRFSTTIASLVPDSMRLNSTATGFESLAPVDLAGLHLTPAEIQSISTLTSSSSSSSSTPPITVLEASPGHSAVAFGDIAEAETVVTLVPGTNSNSADLAAQTERALALMDDSEDVAVVLWSYDAPPNLTEAASADYYETASSRLQNFQAGLAEAGVPKQVVAGYSYGATVVAQATRGTGLHADQVLLVAPPGAGRGINSIADMRLLRNDGSRYSTADTSGRVGVATSPLDPIRAAAGIGVHGRDVADEEFGATVLDLQRADESWLERLRGLSEIPKAHTEHYFGDQRFTSETEKWTRSMSGSGPG
ncbi:alpha/beta hydrolase [Corynebacterium sp. H113]|uniref:alpha/beta hydrolase n=1 Tax=Corynebacterium sp. H113 TaxID=3133419 RepID=UPI0030AD9AD2